MEPKINLPASTARSAGMREVTLAYKREIAVLRDGVLTEYDYPLTTNREQAQTTVDTWERYVPGAICSITEVEIPPSTRRTAMRKLYFIASIPATSKDGVITGVVANGTGRNAAAEEVTALVELLRAKGATQSLLDSLRDGTYPGPVSAFERRAAARAEEILLNSFKGGGGLFNWHILEVGESIRNPVRKPLGWRIKYDGGYTSCYNAIEDGATVRTDGDEENTSCYNVLFPTREAARSALETTGDKRSRENPKGYYIEVVYA